MNCLYESILADKVTVVSNKFTAFRIGTWGVHTQETETAIRDVNRPCGIRNSRQIKARILCSQKFWFVSEFS